MKFDLSQKDPIYSNLLQLLRSRASEQADFPVYTFLLDGDRQEAKITCAGLDAQARKIGGFLQEKKLKGERALLLYPPGLDYISAFFGCIYGGVIAVPAYPPDPYRLSRTLPRLKSIIRDSGAKLILTTQEIQSMAETVFTQDPELSNLEWKATDGLEENFAGTWKENNPREEDLVFLQYTSGSTGSPKGVMLSHRNLVHNMHRISQAFRLAPDQVGASWLPPYHDMGLIGGILTPLYGGGRTLLMSPLDFLKKPLSWLRMIHRHKAQISGGPNFAYDLCVRKATPEFIEEIDLSSWGLAFSGAEPVRAETLRRFAETFRPAGFKTEYFYPCYGLAEGTLIVSGGIRSEPPVFKRVIRKSLESHRPQEAKEGEEGGVWLVGCGQSIQKQKVLIVDPESQRSLPEGQVGEIWVSGESVAMGYWKRPEESEKTFQARLRTEGAASSDPDSGLAFLRTGDMGFFSEQELYVTGRIKDLIIINGQNHYPQDIELSIEKSDAAFRPGCGAIFSVERAGDERLVVVWEVDLHVEGAEKEALLEALTAKVRQAISLNHEIQADAVIFIRKGSIYKTSSGKIQRHACRKAYLDGELETIGEWELEKPKAHPPQILAIAASSTASPEKVAFIRDWLAKEIAERMGILPEEIDPKLPFQNFGLDSKEAVNLSGDLETLVGRRLSPTLLWQYPNIETLSNFLGSEASSPESERQEAGPNSEAIAVVGIACRFPGSHDADSFWDQLKEGKNGVVEVPPGRWNVSAYYHPDPATPGKMNIRTGGFIENIDRFDANFFGISPREANRMDPQQRLLLEVAWESLENASTPPERLAGSKTGVFVGISSTEYSHLQFSDPYRVDAYAGTGNAHSVAANRISYLLDLRGPSMAIDTACSSSLVAIHLACQSLKRGECNLALAGGVNILLSPELTLAFSQARMMSSKGRCATFDASADGYVRGEGAGVVVLKRLSDALKDQDRIFALVRGSAVNQDGRTNGLTAPNPSAQQAVVREALHEAGIGPGDLSYVEAHGTGTPLGDPIELEALGEVMGEGHSVESPCWVGSVKTNIGHLESAAGVAGFIKSALALYHELIPPHLHFTRLNEHVPSNLPLKVPVEATPWPSVRSRYAGISSFGFGGTNAHIILEEAPRLEPHKRPEASHHLLKLSAKSPEALQKSAERTLRFLQSNSEVSLSDLCGSANVGRSDFENRAVLLAGDAPELEGALVALAQGKSSPQVKTAVVKRRVKPKLGFLFTGQGSQYPGMGLKLYQSEPTFKKVLEECDETLRPVLGRSLLALMLGKDPESALIHETGFTQPALFILEIALAELMKSWGVHPDFVMGHSVGEYVAACVAGIFSREEGLKLIAERGRLMQELPKVGGMLAARMSEAKALQILAPYAGEVSLAAINGPQSVVFSGRKEKIEALEKELLSQGIGAQALQVSHAFHSPLMDPILSPFEEKAQSISFKIPRIPLISNLTGRILEAGEGSASYFRRHLREAVRFEGGIRFLADRGCEIFLELGPKPILIGMGKRCFDRAPGVWLSTLDSNRDDEKGLLGAAGDLYLQGVPLDWKGLSGEGRRVSLPSYPFEGKRYWFDMARRSRRGVSSHPLLGERVSSALKSWQFESEISLERLPYLRDHRLSGQVLYPAAAYVETALAAAKEYFGEGGHTLREISLEEALFLGDAESRVLQLTLHPRSESQADFEIFSADEKAKDEDKKWRRHAKGRIERSSKNPASRVALQELKGLCSQELPREGFYGALAKVGLEYGNQFQGIRKVFRGERQALGYLAPPEGFSGTEGYGTHPALLDAAFQVLAASLPAKQPANGGDPLFIPVGFGRIAVHAPWPASFFCHGSLRPGSDPHAKELKGDLKIYDEAGTLLAEVEEFRLKSMVTGGKAEGPLKKGTRAYSLRWESSERGDPPSLGPSAFEGLWLIFSDEEGRGEALSQQLKTGGAQTICVRAGAEFKAIDSSTWMIRSEAKEDYARLLNEILGLGGPPLKGIVHLWGLKNYSVSDFSKDFQVAQRLGPLSLLRFFQELGEKRLPENPRLWIVTRKAQPVKDLEPLNLLQAPLWGLGRTLALEHPEFKTVLLDLDEEGKEPEAENIFEGISRGLSGDPEGQIAFRAQDRHVLRIRNLEEPEGLSPESGALKLPSSPPYRLEVSPTGVMEEMQFKVLPFAELQPGQVEIQVEAAGLNFSDVLKALGLYPGLKEGPVPVGIECAGRISRVGPGVSRWKAGDEVAAIAPFCFASHTVTSADYILSKPSFLSFEEAATIPVAFLTAHYALNTLGRMQAGERVLIHAGAGGVGIAAIQLAKAQGLEVYATAGSLEKRAYLKTLGVKEVFDSRSLDFAEEILQATGGEGVDLVLNSLPGEFIPKSLSVLRAYGRFLEIGKIDIYQDRPLGLLPFQNNLSYFAIDLDRLLRERPAFVLGLFKELMELFERKVLKPLPLTSFKLSEAVRAFRYMAQRKNTGKVILSMENGGAEKAATLFSSEASYLITGGLGALGLQAARWMTENGARSLILLGRNTPNAEVQKTLNALEKAGAKVHVFSVDVGDAKALEGLFEKFKPLPPLRGVFHAAGVLEDGIFENLSPEKFEKVLSPKVKGAWELHRLTRVLPLDFFVMFSSVASVLGSPGQANYAAANAFLDALAHERRAKGLPAHSVNWGPWAGAGMAAAVSGTGHDLAARGMGLIDPAEAFTFLQRILQGGEPQELVVDADWRRLAQLYSATGQTPLFADLSGPLTQESAEALPASGGGIRLLNREAILNLNPEERRELLATQIQSHVAKVLGLQSNQLDLAQPLNTLGLDSLMAIEMKNEIESTLKITLPIATLIKGPNIQELAAVLVEELAKPIST